MLLSERNILMRKRRIDLGREVAIIVVLDEVLG
jgi:hypothetical protein